MKNRLLQSAVFVVTIMLLAGMTFAQGAQSGGIAGSVKDPSGAVIGGATVTIINNATKSVERTVQTTADGLFTATLLPPGDYTVSVKAAGFSSYSNKVEVLLNTTSRVDVQLKVGTAAETIEVTTNPT